MKFLGAEVLVDVAKIRPGVAPCHCLVHHARRPGIRLLISWLVTCVLPLEAAVFERAGYGDQDVRGEVHFHLGERCHLGQGGKGGHQEKFSGAKVMLSHNEKKSTKKNSQNNHISQGALTAVSEVERGHQDVVDSIQCVAYTLGAGGISESQAKSKLERALKRISKPVSLLGLD